MIYNFNSKKEINNFLLKYKNKKKIDFNSGFWTSWNIVGV